MLPWTGKNKWETLDSVKSPELSGVYVGVKEREHRKRNKET